MKMLAISCACLCISTISFAAESNPSIRDKAATALRKAVQFFREEVAIEGGYLWQYSADLEKREGEGKVTTETVWVQPPGTPAIGEAYLDAYEATGDAYYLEAAGDVAGALLKGQLESGGWDYRIEFEPDRRASHAYRVAPSNPEGRNTTTLDDDTTQAALRFLIRLDRTLEMESPAVHEAAMYALDRLLAAQYPNGAWPQRFSAPPNPDDYPILKANYPDSWSREYPAKDYQDYYTFNDNTIADMIDTMLDAAEAYGDSRYRAAAEKAGEFILLAQMPEPQPAWAQQYDRNMHPAWARRFEPPAVTGGESQGVMRTLIMLAERTGDHRFLEPIPRAIAYFRASQLPDGRLARFYELQTNKPLFFTKDYELTYSSDDMPTHYSFISNNGLDAIEAAYKRVLEGPETPGTEPKLAALAEAAEAVIDGMDERGAWVDANGLRYHGDDDPTDRILSCRTFLANVRTLCAYIAAAG